MAEVFTYASPESVGIPSAEIEACIRDLETQELYMHSFMVIRYGKIVAEGYWKPFYKDFRHRKALSQGQSGFLDDYEGLAGGDRIE